jgi:hypothetical protein
MQTKIRIKMNLIKSNKTLKAKNKVQVTQMMLKWKSKLKQINENCNQKIPNYFLMKNAEKKAFIQEIL